MSRGRALALALGPFLLALGLGWAGVDFGNHWDEAANKINGVAYSLEHDFTLLPDGYLYPSVNYWLTLGALAPETAGALSRSGPDAAALRRELAPVLRRPGFTLRLRRIYGFLSALGPFWIVLAGLAWAGGGWPEALAGGLALATSWEYLYHSRWIAPDAVLAQFAALVLLLLVRAWKKGDARCLTAAAAVTGLAAGTKYPGGLLLVPVLAMAVALAPDGRSLRGKLAGAGVLALIFAGVFLATTPGAVLQPLAFYSSLQVVRHAYSDGWYGYTVPPGWPHLARMLFYLSTRGFSAYPAVAAAFFVLAAAGVWAGVRQDLRGTLLLLLFPVLYALYFATQATMVVRNYLIELPFAAFFCGRGIAWVRGRLPPGRWRWAPVWAVAGLLAVDAADQAGAAASIVHRNDGGRFLAEFFRHAESHPQRILLVSDRLEQALKEAGDWPRPNLVPSSVQPRPPFAAYAGYNSEIILPRELYWPTNRPGGFLAVFGEREINLDYYILWSGSEKIVCLSPALAAETGLPAPAGAKAAHR